MRAQSLNLSARLSLRTRQVAGAVALALAVVTAVVVSLVHPHVPGRRMASANLGASGTRLTAFRVTNPSGSRAPGPDFVRDCLLTGAGYRGTILDCDLWARVNINRARRSEGLANIKLPKGWARRTNGYQLVVVTDAERASRGLSNLGRSSSLHNRALAAAYAETDPTGPSGQTWVSNWAGYYRTPLAADYAWMYDDGLGGTNENCTTSDPAGCWAHRDNILSRFRGSMGASEVFVGGMWSTTEVMVSA